MARDMTQRKPNWKPAHRASESIDAAGQYFKEEPGAEAQAKTNSMMDNDEDFVPSTTSGNSSEEEDDTEDQDFRISFRGEGKEDSKVQDLRKSFRGEDGSPFRRRDGHIPRTPIANRLEEDMEPQSRTKSGKLKKIRTPQNQNGNVPAVRRRRLTPNTKQLDRTNGPDNQSRSDEKAIWQDQGRPLPYRIAEDGWKLVKTALKLPAILYPLWKWILLGYIAWLTTSYLVMYAYRSATAAIAPICAIPIIGSQLPFCTFSFVESDSPVDVSKVATAQDELTIVMDRVGQNFDLARDMVGHEFAVRDLRIRVAASNLARGKELTRELESLVRYTKQTAKGLSRFTAKVGKSIDEVKIFDDYAVKALEGIAERQRNPPTLQSQIVSAISPFAAFSLTSVDHDEEQVKNLFITTATRISNKVKLLLDDSFILGHEFDLIQETLDHLKELATDEIGDLPRMDVLSALWARLARADDYEQHQSHSSLLTDMTRFYHSASTVMEETTAALNHIEAELSEFRDDFATPGLTLKDDPLEMTIALLRSSAQRLEAGRSMLEGVPERQHQINEGAKPVTKTVTVSLA